MYVRINPVFDPSVRSVCTKPYPLHKKGCPNWGKKKGCPPSAPLLPDAFDLTGPCYLIINEFPIGEHVAKMRALHPDWSQRQLECCLYWQGTARKQLKAEIKTFLEAHPGNIYRVETCPEAMGLNVTATMHQAGLKIEWPPVNVARQIAFAALASAARAEGEQP